MTLIGEILKSLQENSPIPATLLAQLEPAEQQALREIEAQQASQQRWRIMSRKLLEISQMLNSGRVTQALFSAIVAHIKDLINADIGYISLNDPDTGYTKVLATKGALSEEFQNISIPIGTGILGRVVATKAAAWTYDHATDPRVTHVEDVDHAVSVEGVRGILGAPIAVSGETIGALLVADRRPRSYTPEDIMAVNLLASIAGVALENAKIIEEQQQAVASLEESQQRLEHHVSQLERITAADSALIQLLSGRPQLRELARILQEQLGTTIAIYQPEVASPFIVAQAEGAPRPKDSHWQSLVDRCHEAARRDQHYVTINEPDGSALPIELNGRLLGMVLTATALGDTETLILSHASSAFRATALFDQAVADATAQKVDEIIHLAAQSRITPALYSRFRSLTGIDLSIQRPRFFVAVSDTHDRLDRHTLASRLGPGKVALSRHEHHWCAIIEPDAAEDFLGSTPPECKVKGLEIFAGIAPITAVGSAAEAHREALELLQAVKACRIPNRLLSRGHFGPLSFLLNLAGSELSRLTSPQLLALVDYDAQHDTELEHTLLSYLDNGQSIPATAELLYLHPNTVRQRLGKITSILGEGWQLGLTGLDLHLGLQARRLLRGQAEN